MYCCLMNRQIILTMPPPPILSACCPRGADHCSSLATTAHSLMRSSHHCSISTPHRFLTQSERRLSKTAQAPPLGPPASPVTTLTTSPSAPTCGEDGNDSIETSGLNYPGSVRPTVSRRAG